MRFCIFLCISLLASFPGLTAEEAQPPSPHALVTAVEQTVRLLEQYGLLPNGDTARQAVLSAMIRSADPGGLWLDEEQYKALRDRLTGLAWEVGVRFHTGNGHPRVTDVVKDSPAAQAGLQAGDVIEAIQGGSVTGLKDGEVQHLLRGRPTDRILVRFVRAGVTQEVELATTRLPQSSVASAEDLPGGIGYLRLNGLFEGAAKEVIPALRGWDGTNYCGIVVDLRGAGGTNLAAVAEVARLFAQDGDLLFSLRDARDQDLAVFRATGVSRMELPVMALTDEHTEGASEALAAVLAGSLRGAMLIGFPTRGDPAVREILPCPGGGWLYVATRRLVTADGALLNGREGLQPHVLLNGRESEYEYEPEPDRKGRLAREETEHRLLRNRVRGDPALRRAVDILLALKALNVREASRTPP